MANSAQLTSSVSYSVPDNFYPATELQIPIPVSVAQASYLNNFAVNSDGNLYYTGFAPAKISLFGLISIGAFKPSEVPPPPLPPFDTGPKVTMSFYAKVGSQVGNATNLIMTFYYQAFEWPITTFTTTTDDQFIFNPGDVITFWAKYDYIPLNPSVPPAGYYVNIQQCALSLTAFSSEAIISNNPKPLSLLTSNNTVEIPTGLGINTPIYTFKPHVKGLALVEVVVNIPEVKAYDNSTGTYGRQVLGVNLYAYLAINGVLDPQQLAFCLSGANPFIYDGDTMFPSSMIVRLLVDLRQTDEVSVIMNADGLYIPIPDYPYFKLLDEGKLSTNFEFSAVTVNALSPQAMLTQTVSQPLFIPLDTYLNTAIEVPLIDCILDSTLFELDSKEGTLTYVGQTPSWFKFKAIYTASSLVINDTNLETPVVTTGNLGLAIGVDGQQVNSAAEESYWYTDVQGTFIINASNSAINAFRVKPGDRISLLLFANDAVFITVPPQPSAVTKTPGVGSTVSLTGKVILSIE